MILGLLSDTHLRSADDRLKRLLAGPLSPADALLHAGDYTGEEVLDYLESVDPRPFYGVAGNIDGDAITRRLPSQRVVELEGRRIGLVHGWGAPAGIEDRVLQAFSKPIDVVVYGHTHEASRSRRGETLLVNPGSAFDRRFAPQCTVAFLSLSPAGVAFRVEEVPR